MTHRPPRLLWLLPLLTWATLGGCQEDEIITPTRYLERPNAVDFFCVGPMTAEPIENPPISALPAHACAEDTTGSGNRKFYGLVTNSGRSEVAMVDFSRGALVDLADQNPGFGFIPVGESPVSVKITEDGCAGYVVNHGSCDLSVINVNRTLAAKGYRVNDDSAPGAPTARLALASASGRLLARPAELALRPEWLMDTPPIEQCRDVVGHRAYVSLPACGLVAEVDLDTGRILQSLKFDGGTVQLGGIDPQCPAECVPRCPARCRPDCSPECIFDPAATHDPEEVAYAPVTDTLSADRPGPMLVTWDGLRLVIGSATLPQITVVDLDIVNGQFLNPRIIPLAEETRGVRRLRQSPYTFEHDWYFFYAVTRSGVIHVLDADVEAECETNPDPTDPFFPTPGETIDRPAWEAWEAQKGCLRLGEPDTPERAPGIETPAIVMPSGRVAVDVAFVELEHTAYSTAPDSLTESWYLGGAYAYAVTMDGLAYLINVDETYIGASRVDDTPDYTVLDHRRADGVHAVLSHQLRTSLDTDEEEDGRPRPRDEEEQDLFLDGERVGDTGVDPYDHLAPGAMPRVTVLDPYRVRSEFWTLEYMGPLPRTRRDSGQLLRADLATVGPGQAELRDAGVGFCQAGVREGDVLVLKGCEEDGDCAEGSSCYRSNSQGLDTLGICLDDTYRDRLIGPCEALAVSRREYVVVWAADDHLVVEPRELTEDGISDCTDAVGYCCQGEGTEEVIVGIRDAGRCLAGPVPSVAVEVGTGASGDPIVRSCFDGLVDYEVRVAESQYLLTGTGTGTLVSGVPDVADGGHCVDDPDRSPYLTARVPRDVTPFRNAVLEFELDLASATSGVLPTPGYTITFEMVGGFNARVVDVSARLPAVVEASPDGHLYVIDQGDENTQGGLQGQVLRLLPGDIALDTSFVVR